MTRPPERRFFVLFMGFWLPVLVYVTVIFSVSAQPQLTPPFRFANVDKVAHVAEYLVLGLLLTRAFRATLRVSRPLFAAVIAVGFVALVGVADETLQFFIPGRSCSPYDLVADVVGGTLAQVVYVALAGGR